MAHPAGGQIELVTPTAYTMHLRYSTLRRLTLANRALVAPCALLIAVVTSLPVYAQDSVRMPRSTIRGRVTVDSGKPVVGADVIVVMAPDRSFQRTTTDSGGSYEIVFEHGTGDYLIHAAAPGMETFRKRVTGPPTDSVLLVNISLTHAGAQQLSAVSISARRWRPRRGGDFGVGAGPGAAEQVAGGVTGAVPPDLVGDLATIAATVPGIALTPQGVSVAGLSPGQNSATLDGMAFSGADVPRDALTTVRVTTSTYDPARGWFGGLQEDVELTSGVVASLRHVHFNMDAASGSQASRPASADRIACTSISSTITTVPRSDDGLLMLRHSERHPTTFSHV